MSIEFFICYLLANTILSLTANQCDEKIFIFITKKHVQLIDFNSPINSTSSIIYQTKINTTIENGLFHKQKNTIILLINQSNETFSILTLNVANNIYENWIEKTNKLIYSSSIYLSFGQRYFYILNQQTMLLQIFNLPLTSTVFKQNYLNDLPQNSQIIHYLIDEKFQYLWILFKYNQYQLYQCQLKSLFSCQLYMNIYHLNLPIQFLINWNIQQLYLYTYDYFLLFEYNFNQMNYSIHYLKFSHVKFLTICEQKNLLEYISFNQQQQVCYDHCRDLMNTTIDYIHNIQRLSSQSNILYCSKQRRISKIILLILILIDLALVFAALCWLTMKYFSQSTMNKQISNGVIWISEKELITHF